jgi:DNA-binding IscR family transcriptional regulator
MFSKTFGYALRAAAFVAIHGTDGRKVGLHEISKELEIPHHFLGKIMQDLVRHGILDSLKGPSGGFYVNLVFNQCALNIKRCSSDHPCPLHHDFAVCREGMLKVMAVRTIGEMAHDVKIGNSFLVR